MQRHLTFGLDAASKDLYMDKPCTKSNLAFAYTQPLYWFIMVTLVEDCVGWEHRHWHQLKSGL